MFPLKIVQYKHIIQISSISSNSIKFSFLTILSKNYQTCILSYNIKFKNFNPNTNFQHDETNSKIICNRYKTTRRSPIHRNVESRENLIGQYQNHREYTDCIHRSFQAFFARSNPIAEIDKKLEDCNIGPPSIPDACRSHDYNRNF